MKDLSVFLVGLLLVGTMATCGMYAGEKSTAPNKILVKAKDITSVKYDLVTRMPNGETITQNVWMKENNMRIEATIAGLMVITIVNAGKQEMYIYYPERNTAMKMPFKEGDKPETSESIAKYNPRYLGIQTIDGKFCDGYEYVDHKKRKVEIWIWKEHDFPVLKKINLPEGTMVMEYKNISFGDIPDSMFELPAGVKITEISE